MTLQRLQIEQFRLLNSLEISLAPGVNLFVGPNAQGKTSILEAVHYLSVGRSFRTTRDAECRSLGSTSDAVTSVTGSFGDSGTGLETLRFAYAKPRKHFWLNGHPVKTLSELWGKFTTVLFEPADLHLLQGPPANRRAFLDRLLGQLRPQTLLLQKRYAEALNHRNALLKRHGATVPEFDAYEAQMAEYGLALYQERRRCVDALSLLAGEFLPEIAPENHTLAITYEPGFSAKLGEIPEEKESAVEWLRRVWREKRSSDAERATTTEGFHRDDFSLLLNAKDARIYGSQGEVRTCTLTLRLAELELLSRESSGLPLLLLDDLLGELDRDRSARFLSLVAARRVQTLITATNAQAIETQLPVEARFVVEAGQLRRV
ncbi:MAG: DNA replication and repair protein RecF [Candidatus Sumerlaeia bacterium]|nr:DNA replication and repair protein RecF [Candidatus Sumerlaeia bacterium]